MPVLIMEAMEQADLLVVSLFLCTVAQASGEQLKQKALSFTSQNNLL